MFKKNSIFKKILIPIAMVVLLQAILVNVLLFSSGTFDILDDNSLGILTSSAQSRSSDLEHSMVNYWFNINRFELSITDGIKEYLSEANLELMDVLGNRGQEIELLYALSPILLDYLRFTESTGIFIYFLEGNYLEELSPVITGGYFNGLYFRNLNPVFAQSLQPGTSNIMVLRGHVDIARQHNLPLDSLWEEIFYFNPRYEDLWNSFANPQIAARQFPEATSFDLSYLTRPHLVNPWSPRDVSMQISYTRPLIIDGRLVAIIGTEKQLSQIERFFPARDLDVFGESGFLFVKHDDGDLTVDILSVTGGFLNRLLRGASQVTLVETQNGNVFSIEGHPEVRLVLEHLHLHNRGSLLTHDAWGLAAASTTDSLFAMSSHVRTNVLYSTALTVIGGWLIIFLIVRSFSKPIRVATQQIQDSIGKPITVEATTYEIDLLCQTINDMIERHEKVQQRINKERQLYMLAFTNSADVFTEYDFTDDSLTLFYYESPEQKAKQEPTAKVIHNLMESMDVATAIFHESSLPALAAMYSMEEQVGWDIQVVADFFDHLDITNIKTDEGYFWFATESVAIYDVDGNRIKTITAANNITAEKLAEKAAIEARRRDLSTGFYNRTYGLEVCKNKGMSLNLVSIVNFDKLEKTYGKLFGGILVAEFSIAIKDMLEEPDFAIRFSNNQILIVCRNSVAYSNALRAAFDKLYKGEDTNLDLALKIDVLASVEEAKNCPEIPINAFLDLSDKEKLKELALELLEHNLYVNSSIKALLGLIGRIFELDAVIVCAYNGQLGTNKVTHQWCSENEEPVPDKTVKIMTAEFQWYSSLLDEDGTMVYNKKNRDMLLEKLLCITDTSASTYCCSMYEAGMPVGRILFVSSKPKNWDEEERSTLSAITKLITTYSNTEKLRLASQAKSMVISRISQEINVPANSIEEKDGVASELQSQNGNLQKITNILEMSWVEGGQLLQAENQQFNLHDFLREIEDLMRPVIENRKITFSVAAEVMHSNVSGDTHLLQQVLVNLLDNAYKFTEPRGFIGLNVTEEEPWQFIFSVKDSGIGIPLDKQQSLLEPFKPTTKAANPSNDSNGQQKTGLGLTVSQNMLLAMSSKLMISSAPNMGSDFYFVLNLKPPTSSNSD